ncbi:hypothetical protein GJ688_13545 [Heliobacillus mobilis]|uniref:Uncharacterized protein n=1 Tax=Heliobacterium mobile TaxID=28064 RepID=A0A6I3SM80_HELMO|nr:hypothetical protein [Heliobacterium mobile]MTV49999.1 hypothetical protein [Heliobacterium mobile]
MKQRKSSYHTEVICLALTVSFSVIGVGFGNWQQGLTIKGVVTTGEINPVFSECEVAGESVWPSRIEDCRITDGGKRLEIRLKDVTPDYRAHLKYEITNRGTVPVKVRTETENADEGVHLHVNNPNGVIDGGHRKKGELVIEVGAVEENQDSSFTVDLDYIQWNYKKDDCGQ